MFWPTPLTSTYAIERPSGVHVIPKKTAVVGNSINLVAVPPSNGTIAICHLKPACSSGEIQATVFPSGEIAGAMHCLSIIRVASPPSLGIFHPPHLPSRNAWYTIHLPSLDPTAPVAKLSLLVSFDYCHRYPSARC